ncbi:DUF6518 family protein [Dactylosporangium sp. NPDC051541]|uniref:DUF6518 family protein n=1 Tax=Dactylosporangium sp. NPDC051541 TaxID=3363977 RepID=UPI0037AE1816
MTEAPTSGSDDVTPSTALVARVLTEAMTSGSGLLAAALGGMVLGALSLLLNGVLPGGSSRLVNSGAVWVVGAFVAGAVLRDGGWRTWLAGTAVLVGAVAGYYGSLVVFEHRTMSPGVLTGPAQWALVGLAAGPLFATAGAWWRDPRRARRVVALCLLGGVFVAEGAYLLASHRPPAEALLVSAAGVLVPLALGRGARDRLFGVMGLLPAAVAGFGGYLVLDAVMDVAFTRAG